MMKLITITFAASLLSACATAKKDTIVEMADLAPMFPQEVATGSEALIAEDVIDSYLDNIDADQINATAPTGDALFLGFYRADVRETLTAGTTSSDTTTSIIGEARIGYTFDNKAVSISVPTLYERGTDTVVGSLEVPEFGISPNAEGRFENDAVGAKISLDGGDFRPFNDEEITLSVSADIGQPNPDERAIFAGFVDVGEELVLQSGIERHNVTISNGGIRALEIQ